MNIRDCVSTLLNVIDEFSGNNTILNIARNILGDSEEINSYQKFKRLTRAYPENKNFKRNMDVALAKLQTAVSSGHSKLKSELENI